VGESRDIASRARPSDDEAWRRWSLFYATTLGLPVVMLAVWISALCRAGNARPANAVVAIAVVGYAALASAWAVDAHRAGAPWSQRLFGAVAGITFLFMCVVLLLEVYGIDHAGIL
jgi:hypothetical protein